jgi:hypothetical protein
MPIYEWKCEKCSRVVETYMTISEADADDFFCGVCAEKGLQAKMGKCISLCAPPQFGPGTPGTSSQLEYAARQKSMLEARSKAYDESPKGKEEKAQVLQRITKTM